jgi:hypothetical protein
MIIFTFDRIKLFLKSCLIFFIYRHHILPHVLCSSVVAGEFYFISIWSSSYSLRLWKQPYYISRNNYKKAALKGKALEFDILIFLHDVLCSLVSRFKNRVRICKRLRSAGIDSKESITPAYVDRRLESISGLLKRLQILAQVRMKLNMASFSATVKW